jgi:hypothetical protein
MGASGDCLFIIDSRFILESFIFIGFVHWIRNSGLEPLFSDSKANGPFLAQCWWLGFNLMLNEAFSFKKSVITSDKEEVKNNNRPPVKKGAVIVLSRSGILKQSYFLHFHSAKRWERYPIICSPSILSFLESINRKATFPLQRKAWPFNICRFI